MSDNKKAIGVRLNPWLRQELSNICNETGAKASVVVRAALKKFIDDYNSTRRDG